MTALRFQADADLNHGLVLAMPQHFADFIATAPSPGVIVVPQHLRIASAAEDLLLIAEATDPSDWRNRIAFLPI
jgi:hypothetical protein